LLVTGLGAGAERDAMTLIRMQADLQNQGYAAGAAAAMAAANGGRTRSIDLRALRKQMVEKGVLQPRVLTDRDSCPMSAESIQKAVADVGALKPGIKQSRTVEDPAIFSLAVVMAHSEQSLPLLRKAHAEAAEPAQKLVYARILGVLGDKACAPTLIAAVTSARAWDTGFGLTSHRESHNTFSDVDRLVIALGMSGAPEGLEAIAGKIGQLKPGSELSHFIAAAMAIQNYSNPKAAAEPLARLLEAPGFTGHALDAAAAQQGTVAPRDVASDKPDTNLNAAFKELLVAGMLFRFGDSQERGKRILEQYSRGVIGHFSRYARCVLQAGRPAPSSATGDKR
jgi:hypothetical protein